MLRAANNQQGHLYEACLGLKIRIRDLETQQNFFIQKNSTYLMILRQTYIMAIRIETKVLDNSSFYVRIRDNNKKILVKIFILKSNHEKNRD